MEKICKNCVFFNPSEPVYQDKGKCRRFPPQPDRENPVLNLGSFPGVSCNWTCGEYTIDSSSNDVEAVMKELRSSGCFKGEIAQKVNKLIDERKIANPCGTGCSWPWCLNQEGKCTQ